MVTAQRIEKAVHSPVALLLSVIFSLGLLKYCVSGIRESYVEKDPQSKAPYF